MKNVSSNWKRPGKDDNKEQGADFCGEVTALFFTLVVEEMAARKSTEGHTYKCILN